jgi:hypothetical protein
LLASGVEDEGKQVEVEEEEVAVVVVLLIPVAAATPASDVNKAKSNSRFLEVGESVLVADTVRHAQLG